MSLTSQRTLRHFRKLKPTNLRLRGQAHKQEVNLNPRDPEPLWLEEKDWLCTLEFLSRKDATTRASDAEDLGYLVGYAQLTDTRVLALVGDRGDEVYEILFSFSSPERKWKFLELVRSNEDMGDWYVRDEFLVPMTARNPECKAPNDGASARCYRTRLAHRYDVGGWGRRQSQCVMRSVPYRATILVNAY